MSIYDPIIKTADIFTIGSVDNSLVSKVEPERWLVKNMSGLTYPLDSDPAYYNFCDNLNFEESFIEDLSGQWVAVTKSINSETYKILTDHFGFQSVFYRYDITGPFSSNLVISTSYSSLLQYSKVQGLPSNLNNAQFYLAMSSSNLLLRSAFSTNTFCKEIKLLGANEYLLFKAAENNLEIRSKDFLYDVHHRSFDELMNFVQTNQ